MWCDCVRLEVHLYDIKIVIFFSKYSENCMSLKCKGFKHKKMFVFNCIKSLITRVRYGEQYCTMRGAYVRYGVLLAFSTLSCATDNINNLCDRMLLMSNKERQFNISLSQQFSYPNREAAIERFPLSVRYAVQVL